MDIAKYVLIAAVLFGIYMSIDPDCKKLPVWLNLIINTCLIFIYLAYLFKKDLPLKSLPVIGKYFK